jgi:hypothetical protein
MRFGAIFDDKYLFLGRAAIGSSPQYSNTLAYPLRPVPRRRTAIGPYRAVPHHNTRQSPITSRREPCEELLRSSES